MKPWMVAAGSAVGGALLFLAYKKATAATSIHVPIGQSTTPIGKLAQSAASLNHPISAPLPTLDVQRTLNAMGYGLTENGALDAPTIAAIKAFQAKANLTVDGIVGPQTSAALRAAPAQTFSARWEKDKDTDAWLPSPASLVAPSVSGWW